VSNQSAGLKDYLALTKPVILSLLLMTTLAGMIVGGHGVPPVGAILWTLLGGALAAGGASALNQYTDRDLDAQMMRTRRRPIPAGRLDPARVLTFGLVLCTLAFYTLAIFVNLLSALLALAGMIYYVVLYGLVLKRSTVQNIVVGGGAGAIPPLVGWAAATGSLDLRALFLFAVVFFWTPAHFWALALLRQKDYERAGVPMLPVVYGEREARFQILLYALQVVLLTLILSTVQSTGWVYLTSAAILGAGLLTHAVRLWRRGGARLAWSMYRYSSIYLALLFAALIADTLIHA
jgi:protoheme IX farnesyltransferase